MPRGALHGTRARPGRPPRGLPDRQPLRCRHRHELRHFQTEEVRTKGIGHLVVLGPTDAVNKQVGDAQPGEERRRQRPRTETDAISQQRPQILDIRLLSFGDSAEFSTPNDFTPSVISN